MTELTEYLIELGKMLGVDTDTEGCGNPNLALSARIVLAIRELRQPLQWKGVDDGLPEVKGRYTVKYKFPMGDDQVEEAVEFFEPNECEEYWHDYILAYIPVPIPK